MQALPLGTSSGVPTLNRNVSALAVTLDSHWLLFDCGEGTQYRVQASPLRPHRLQAIFITHLHGDHVFGLPGLLGTMGMQRREIPLEIYGPPGLRAFLTSSFSLSDTHLSYPITIHEVQEGPVCETREYRVRCRALDHRIPAFGYRLEGQPHTGRLRVERALELGLRPGVDFSRIKRGEPVNLPDGREVAGTDLLERPAPPASLAYCTDTRPCQASVELARDVDLLIHEATYLDELRELASERGHSTAAQAASIALEAGAQKLLLTHFSPRYADTSVLVREASAIFPNTVAASDLEAVPLIDPMAKPTAPGAGGRTGRPAA